jgi:hypothetical protein
MDRSKTHIKVELKRETHKRLSELGKKGETFDDIIQRILNAKRV